MRTRGHGDTERCEPPSAPGRAGPWLRERQTRAAGGSALLSPTAGGGGGGGRFPIRLSQSVLQRWRWFKCGSGDGGGASVLPCPQPPSESGTEEGGAAADLVSLGLRGLRSSRGGGWQVQPQLWILLPCDSPGNGLENSKYGCQPRSESSTAPWEGHWIYSGCVCLELGQNWPL